MKRLLFVALSVFAFAVQAADAPADAKKAPAAKKAQAKTKASPKADAKGKAKKAPSNAFQAYEAGEWLPVDNKKGHLLGYHITDGDLRHQPVLIVKFDPDVEVSQDDRESDPKYIYQFMGWETKVQPHLQVVNVPSRPLTKDELPLLGKIAGKTGAVAGFPWYANVGLAKEPENAAKVYPFYYVVSTDGKVIYAGNKGKQAQSEVYGALKKSGEPDPLFGFVKPNIHSNVVANLKLGDNVTAANQKLKQLALKGTPESMAEAQALVDALDQAQTYWFRQIAGTMGSNPPQAFLLAGQVVKSFPKNKDIKPVIDKIKASSSTVLPTFIKVAAIGEKLKALEEKGEQPKKADLKKWYPLVCTAEKKVNAAKKSMGDNLPRAFLCLDDLVQTVKAELEAQGAGAK